MNTQQTPAIIFFALLLLVSYACTKDNTPGPETRLEILSTSGTIVYTGMLAADGCEYVFRTSDGQSLKPLNLSADFEQDGLPVTVQYNLSNEPYACGLSPNAMQTINVVKIDRQ